MNRRKGRPPLVAGNGLAGAGGHVAQGRVARGVIMIVGMAWLGMALAGCQGPHDERRLAQFLGGGKETAGDQESAPNAPNAQVGMSRPAPLGPEVPPQPSSDPPQAGTLTQPELYPGAGFGIRPAVQTNPVVLGEGGEVTLNFVNADIREVVDTVLGTTLKVNFVIDPRVQGVVTLRTARPVLASQVIGVLEDVLAMNGVALVESGGLYKVVPVEDAVTAPQILSQGGAPVRLERGFGLHVIPLRFASAAELGEVVQAFVPPGRVLRSDPVRNLLIFVGTGTEARDIEDLVATFDVDWMRGMSFALLPLQVADPEAMAAELDTIFGQQEGGALAGVIQFLPIKRLSAVLVITSQPTYLNDARQWVARLDRGQEGDQRRLYVYYVQNGRASEIADVLGQVFGYATGTAEREEPPELAPGLTPFELSGGSGGLGESTYQTGEGGLGSGTGFGSSATRRARQERAQTGGGDLGEPLSAPSALEGGGAAESQVRIVADTRNNALVVYATPTEYATIAGALDKLDIVPLQVMIEATIAEVTLNDALRYGVEWFFDIGDSTITFNTSDVSTPSPAENLLLSVFPGFSYMFAADGAKVVINALSQVTDVKVISSPQLLVLDNETARLQVGDQVPILTRTTDTGDAGDVVSEIEYRDTGVILDIIPRVNAGGLVVLDIVQQVSDVTETQTSGIDSPTIQQREIASTVAINSGESIALGGLIRESNENGVTGIPVLSEIPVLGNLFKTTSDIVGRTELLVLLTPRVIRDRYDARAVTEDLRKRLRSLPPLVPKIQ
jgi:general secretion pathway protein D